MLHHISRHFYAKVKVWTNVKNEPVQWSGEILKKEAERCWLQMRCWHGDLFITKNRSKRIWSEIDHEEICADMIMFMVLASDNVIWSVREAPNAPNNLFMRLAVRSVKWRKQNLTGAQFKRVFYKQLLADGEDGEDGDDDGTMVYRMTIRMRVMMTIDTIFVDNQGWGGASSLPVSASSPLFPSSIVWWAPFVFQLFYEVWYCSSYCLYPCVNSLSDPCPIIVLQFVQSLSQSDSICFPKQLKVCKKKYQSWNMEWGVRWNWSLNKSC